MSVPESNSFLPLLPFPSGIANTQRNKHLKQTVYTGPSALHKPSQTNRQTDRLVLPSVGVGVGGWSMPVPERYSFLPFLPLVEDVTSTQKNRETVTLGVLPKPNQTDRQTGLTIGWCWRWWLVNASTRA